MSDLPKDPLFGFRNTIRGKDSKGRDTLTLYLDQEHVATMIETLQGLEENEAGVKFVFHTGKKTAGESGRTFDSTFGFVKATQSATSGTSKIVPKAAPTGYNNLNKTVS